MSDKSSKPDPIETLKAELAGIKASAVCKTITADRASDDYERQVADFSIELYEICNKKGAEVQHAGVIVSAIISVAINISRDQKVYLQVAEAMRGAADLLVEMSRNGGGVPR